MSFHFLNFIFDPKSGQTPYRLNPGLTGGKKTFFSSRVRTMLYDVIKGHKLQAFLTRRA